LITLRATVPALLVNCDVQLFFISFADYLSATYHSSLYLLHICMRLQFNHNNDIDLICRAHQLVMEGYKYHFPAKNLVTVWSAPNYCYRCGNVASVLAIDDHLNRDFKLFTEVPEATDLHKRNTVPYFL
jgi:serine/threonine-protein phosphatase 6 catalytic subunit